LDEAVASRPDVHWLGAVLDRSRLSQLYSAASLVVAHSHLEGFGMTTLEAMESETPVIASDIPGHREICGDAAVYYDPRDAQSLGSAVRTVLLDDDLRKELIVAGRHRSERFDWEQNAMQLCGIFVDAVHSLSR
jgi:glycosyltransferase involved in cell wall biosynthesis